jgi:hypothetical protein
MSNSYSIKVGHSSQNVALTEAEMAGGAIKSSELLNRLVIN